MNCLKHVPCTTIALAIVVLSLDFTSDSTFYITSGDVAYSDTEQQELIANKLQKHSTPNFVSLHFLHSSYNHLWGNLRWLIPLSLLAELVAFRSSWKYAAWFILTLLTTSLAILILDEKVVGISGFLYALATTTPLALARRFSPLPYTIHAATWFWCMLVLLQAFLFRASETYGNTTWSRVSWEIHLAGAITGVAVFYILIALKKLIPENWR